MLRALDSVSCVYVGHNYVVGEAAAITRVITPREGGTHRKAYKYICKYSGTRGLRIKLGCRQSRDTGLQVQSHGGPGQIVSAARNFVRGYIAYADFKITLTLFKLNT